MMRSLLRLSTVRWLRHHNHPHHNHHSHHPHHSHHNRCHNVEQRRAVSHVLGIETSCDDTGIAVVSKDGRVVSEVVASQTALHVSNGGIIPPVARDLHKSVIDRCVVNCLQAAAIRARDLDAIAVTVKPGLPLSLVIGCRYAKKLSAKYNLPVIPIHHMEAHALTALLPQDTPSNQPEFPYLSLLISGGHCILVYVADLHDFRLLGQSVDDAPGDILDKVARTLKLKNLGPPFSVISGGAAVEAMAKHGDPFSFFEKITSYPLYSSRRRTCNFSFSGFRTAVTRKVQQLEREIQLPPDQVLPQAADLCASILYIISFILIKRVQRAFQFLEEREVLPAYAPRHLVVSGGCAANRFIANMLANYCDHASINLHIPPPRLCTDNGVMVAWNGVLKLLNEHRLPPGTVLHHPDQIEELDIEARSPLGIDISDQVTMANIKCERIDIKSFVDFHL